MTEKTYNGWRNYETWNVALWIQNDQGLYQLALDRGDFDSFREFMREIDSPTTPDNVAWDLPCIDREAIENMFAELLKNYFTA
tara:strand:+ start:668 stop:916 length:249 start_codon:yes stop_codon:yes gene_type:complete